MNDGQQQPQQAQAPKSLHDTASAELKKSLAESFQKKVKEQANTVLTARSAFQNELAKYHALIKQASDEKDSLGEALADINPNA